MASETGLKVKLGAEKTFTAKQITALLQQQIADCADVIQGDNLSEYTAKRKIMSVKLVEIK